MPHHIPHFGFPERVVAFGSQFIVRMHLYREVVVGINQLNQQRKLLAKLFEDPFANQVPHVDFNQFLQVVPFQRAVGHHRNITLNPREFPALTDFPFGREFFAKDGFDFAAAPDAFLKDGFEFQRI